jgi:hypothetical protein
MFCHNCLLFIKLLPGELETLLLHDELILCPICGHELALADSGGDEDLLGPYPGP